MIERIVRASIIGAVLREINRGPDQPMAFGEIERLAFHDSAKHSFGVVRLLGTAEAGATPLGLYCGLIPAS